MRWPRVASSVGDVWTALELKFWQRHHIFLLNEPVSWGSECGGLKRCHREVFAEFDRIGP